MFFFCLLCSFLCPFSAFRHQMKRMMEDLAKEVWGRNSSPLLHLLEQNSIHLSPINYNTRPTLTTCRLSIFLFFLPLLYICNICTWTNPLLARSPSDEGSLEGVISRTSVGRGVRIKHSTWFGLVQSSQNNTQAGCKQKAKKQPLHPLTRRGPSWWL